MLIREHPTKVVEGEITYVVWICGAERPGGTWEGWLEFHPTDTGDFTYRSGNLSAQPWRTGILGRWT